ncbi:hypothetical protein I3843_08G058200 [Carya illinoinensis]|nr:hypothetical protein I3760_08G059000 [Carya illinoinensis]KAG7966625.1 hypothetical protein I3843_08G058200 [Carya illinoinensis]
MIIIHLIYTFSKLESFFSKSSISKIMEKITYPRSADNEGLPSCWGCLKLKLPWTRQRAVGSSTYTRKRGHVDKLGGRFRYDPFSYALNFDEGWDDDDEEVFQRGFSARYAAPSSKAPEDKYKVSSRAG